MEIHINPNVSFGNLEKIILTIAGEDPKDMFYCGELDSGILDYIEYKYIYNPDRDNLINKYIVEDEDNTLPGYINYIFPTLANEGPSALDSWDKYYGSVNKGDQRYYIIHIPGRTQEMDLYKGKDDAVESPVGYITFSPFENDDNYSSNRLILIIQTKDTIEVLNLGYDLWIYRKNESERNLWKYNLHKNDHGPKSIVQNPRGTEIQLDGTSDALLGLRKITNTPILGKKKRENPGNPWKPWSVYRKGEEVQWKEETWISLENNNRETPDASVKWAKKGNIEGSLNYRIKVYAVPEDAAVLSPSGYISLGKEDNIRIEVQDWAGASNEAMYGWNGVYSDGDLLYRSDQEHQPGCVSGNTEDGLKYFIIPNPKKGNIVFSYTLNPGWPKITYKKNDSSSGTLPEILPTEEINEIRARYSLPSGTERTIVYQGCPIEPYTDLPNFNPGFTFALAEYDVRTRSRRITVMLVFKEMSDEKNFVIDDPTQEVPIGNTAYFKIKAVTSQATLSGFSVHVITPETTYTVPSLSGPDPEGIYTVSCPISAGETEDITVELYKNNEN